MLVYYCAFVAAAISLEIGSYLLVMEFINDIKCDITLFNKTTKSRRNQSQMFKQLRDSIELHGHVKQLSRIES